MSYLIAIALGPVQGFIAAARKTRDLWFGSALLSEVARHTALALDAAGVELIFPAPASLHQDTEHSAQDIPVANRIIGIVPAGHDPAALADTARAAAIAHLDEQRHRTLEILDSRGLRDPLDQRLFDAQIDQLLEFYAAWWPYDATALDGYAAARASVDRLLAGRKALRDFAPAPPADPQRQRVPMSALDPNRAAVLRTERASDLARLGIKAGEWLDGVSLVKRLAPQRRPQRRFVSVSRVAIDPLIRLAAADPSLDVMKRLAADLADTPLVERIAVEDSRLTQYAAFPFDTELFFASSSGDESLAGAGLTPEQAEAARRFHSLAAGLCRIDPPAYLAVLVADGDQIGKAISALQTVDAHRAFSAAGVAFARAAGTIVAAHHGALIYSGGDDVLALAPLDTALDCAHQLNRLFHTTMSVLELPTTPTLSVGVAIGHCLENLQDLLAWGRDAEKVAKRTRDALAVSLHRRSGGTAVTAAHRWAENPLERWNRWIGWLSQGIVPDGAAYELRGLERELRRLVAPGFNVDTLVDVECRRILQRKRAAGGTRPLYAPTIEGDSVADLIVALLDQPVSAADDEQAAPTHLDRLERLVNEMLIARTLADIQCLTDSPVLPGRETTHAR